MLALATRYCVLYCTISRQSDRGNFDPWGVAEKEEKKMKKKQVADNMEIPHTTMSCLKKVPPPRGVGGVQEPKSQKMSYSLMSPQGRERWPFFDRAPWKLNIDHSVSDINRKVSYSLGKAKSSTRPNRHSKNFHP